MSASIQGYHCGWHLLTTFAKAHIATHDGLGPRQKERALEIRRITGESLASYCQDVLCLRYPDKFIPMLHTFDMIKWVDLLMKEHKVTTMNGFNNAIAPFNDRETFVNAVDNFVNSLAVTLEGLNSAKSHKG